MNKKTWILTFIFFSLFTTIFCQTPDEKTLPQKIDFERLVEIPELESKNPIFKEYSFIVEGNYKLSAAGKTTEKLFFKYTVKQKRSTIFTIAARCNIPYDAIATLNGMESSGDELLGKTLVLPTVPGIFIKRDNPQTSIEILLHENYNNETLTKENIYYIMADDVFVFLENKRFTPTERAYFLDSALRLPLDNGSFSISSDFGKRKNPFSGEWKNHNGIDLAALEGTPVHAIKDGSAAYCFTGDETFGNYVILSHDKGKMTSVYAHLSEINVDQYSTVKKGDVIGYVGQTGLATGPHLHFEIRQGGQALNPRDKLNF
ncbi:MAG: M23 family metallopeptidase [Treponema sp.]|nr:M23 family metallopeptidase [Treponema sp.]